MRQKKDILLLGKRLASLLFIALLIVALGATATAANITTLGSGNWNSTTPGLPWPGGTVPLATDNVTIAAGHIVTVTAAASITNLTLSATTSKLVVNSGQTITVSGTFANSGTTTNGVNGPGTILFTGTASIGVFTPTGTRPDVTIGDGSSTNTVTVTAATVAAGVTINNGGTLIATAANATMSSLTINSGGTLTTSRILTVNGATVITGTINFQTTVRADAFNGDVTLNSGAVWSETVAITAAISGNWTNNATTFTASTGTHTFSGATKTLSGTTATVIPSVTFTGNYANSGTLTSATLLTVTGAAIRLTNNGTITATTALSGTGGVTQGATGVLNIGGTSGITTLDALTNPGNTVVYNSTTAGQTIKGTIYDNLTINKLGQVGTLGAATTVNHDLTISAGTLADGGFQITGNATGILSVANGATLQIGAGGNTTERFPTLFATANITLGATSTVNYNWITGTTQVVAGSVGSVGPSTYGNLTITGASGTKTLTSAITVTGNLTIATAGETFADGGNTITVNGNVTNNATHSGAGKILLSGGSASHTVTGAAGTYGTLELNDAQGATFANTSGATTVGTLTVTSGTMTLNSFTTGLTVTTTNVSGTLTFNNATGTRLMGAVTVNTGGVVNVTTAQSTPLITVVSLNINGGTWNNTTVNEPVTLSTGSFTNTGTFNAGTGAYTISGAGTSINGNATTFSNLQIGGTVTNNITAVGGLTVSTTLGGAGTLTQAINANLFIGAALVSPTLAAANTGNTVEYNSTTGGQTIKGGITYYNLIIDKLGQTGTLGAATTVNHDLTISAGTLADGGFQITGNGTGILNVANGAILQIGAGGNTTETFPTLFTTANITLGATSTVRYDATGAMTVAGSVGGVGPSPYGHLTVTGASGTKTVASAITVAGDFIVSGSATLNANAFTATVTGLTTISGGAYLASTAQQTFNGGLTISGGTFTGAAGNVTTTDVTLSSGTLTAPSGIFLVTGNWSRSGGTFTPGTNTITFGGSFAQIIGGASATSFNNLTANNTNGVTLNSSPTIGGTLTLTAGALSIGANTLTLNGPTIAGTPSNLSTTSSSSLSFGGSSLGVTIPSSATALNNLTVNNVNGVSMAGSTTISGALTLTSGALSVGANTLTLNGPTIAGTPANLSTTSSSSLSFGGSSAGVGIPISVTALTDLTIDNSNGVTLNSSPTVSGTLTLTAGALSIGANTLTLNGAISLTSGLLTGGSSSNITFGGGGASTNLPVVSLNNLTINRANGIGLSGNVTVNGTLTFTNGVLTTGSNTAAASAVSRTSGHVFGNLQLPVGTGTNVSRTFDIGDATNFTPVTVLFANVTVAGNLKASSTVGQQPSISTSGINSSKDVNRYWTLTNSGVGFDNYSATFNFMPGDVLGGANTNNFVVREYTSSWATTTIGTKSGTSTQATGLTSFGDFAIGEQQLDHFALSLASPQINGAVFTSTNALTAQDVLNATVTWFDASANNVTLAANSPLTGAVSGLSGGNKLTNAGDFSSGVANLTTLGLKYTGNAATGTFTATAATGGYTGTSGSLTINAATATKFVITGTTSQTAGANQNLTITAQDANGNTAASYSGDKNLTFSGANSSSNPVTSPTVKDKIGVAVAFGTVTTITFTSGVATVSGGNNGVMVLYKAESATISATDGTISSSGSDRLSVSVSAAAMNKFSLSLTTPQTNGVAFTGTNTLTAEDAYGNTVTTYSAAANNVTIAANSPLTGAVSGLSGGNKLNGAGDFVSGVATLTTQTYTGNAATGTFTATAATGGYTGTSGAVTINLGIYSWNGATSDWQVAANWTPTRATPATVDILQFPANSTVTNVPAQTIGQLQLSGGSTVHLQAATAGNTLTVTDVLTTTSGDVLDLGSGVVLGGSLTTLTNNGKIHTAVLSTTSATPIPPAKTWGGTVEYNGSGAQTAVSGTYTTLKVNNSTGVTLAAAANISTLTIGDVTSNSIFNDAGNQVTSTGTLTLTSGTFKLGSAGAATTFPAFATRNITAGTTIEYASGVAQTVSTTPGYSNLVFSGAGTKTTDAAGTLTIGGDWTVGSATLLSTNNTAVSLTGNLTETANLTQGTGAVTIGGNLTLTSGTLTAGNSISIAGSWTNNGATFTGGTSTVAFTGAGKAIGGSASTAFSTLTISGSISVNTSISVNPLMTVTGTGSVTVSNGKTLTITGDLENDGTFINNGTVTVL